MSRLFGTDGVRGLANGEVITADLALRLAQALIRPHKVHFPCDRCGLQNHDPDAVHCKACGNLLCIPDEG